MTDIETPFDGHKDLVDLEELGELQVLVIGLGSLGSWCCQVLGKMGIKWITAYDDDTVDLHNFANQIYLPSDEGMLKARVINEVFVNYEMMDAIAQPEKLVIRDDTVLDYDVVILAVDDIEIRKQVWEACKRSLNVRLYLDARISGTLVQCFAIRPHVYEDKEFMDNPVNQQWIFFDPSESPELNCHAKSIIFPVMYAASHYTAAIYHLVNDTMDRYPQFINYNFEYTEAPVIPVHVEEPEEIEA